MGREVVGSVARRIEAETAIAHNNMDVVVTRVVRTMVPVGRALSLSHSTKEGRGQRHTEGAINRDMDMMVQQQSGILTSR